MMNLCLSRSDIGNAYSLVGAGGFLRVTGRLQFADPPHGNTLSYPSVSCHFVDQIYRLDILNARHHQSQQQSARQKENVRYICITDLI